MNHGLGLRENDLDNLIEPHDSTTRAHRLTKHSERGLEAVLSTHPVAYR